MYHSLCVCVYIYVITHNDCLSSNDYSMLLYVTFLYLIQYQFCYGHIYYVNTWCCEHTTLCIIKGLAHSTHIIPHHVIFKQFHCLKAVADINSAHGTLLGCIPADSEFDACTMQIEHASSRDM